jgi:hypothetical protein
MTPIAARHDFFNSAADYEAAVWLMADALFHEAEPKAGRLINADHLVRCHYARIALRLTTLLTDRHTAWKEKLLTQAAADYHCHREAAMRRSKLSCYHVTEVSQE